jgi:hypothetical protein
VYFQLAAFIPLKKKKKLAAFINSQKSRDHAS